MLKLTQLIKEFRKVASYKVNIQNLHTQVIMLDYIMRKIGKENPIYKSNQQLQFLEINF